MLCLKCKKEIPDNSAYCNYCGKKQTIIKEKKKNTKKRGNGEGSVYQYAPHKFKASICVGYKINPLNGKPIAIRKTRAGFSTRKEALEYIPILKQQQKENQNKNTRPEINTLASYWEDWSITDMTELSKNKQTNYKTAYKRLESIKDIDITLLNIKILQETVNNNASTYYTARDMKSLLSHLYVRAVAEGIVPSNLAKFIKTPKLNAKERSPFNESEIYSLWNDYGKGNKITAYILLMIYTGMMPGELFETNKDMINWEGQYILGSGLKTKIRKKTPIVIADFMIPILKDLCDYSPSNKLLNMGKEAFYKEYYKTLKRCGCRKLTPYSCRHTTGTALALNKDIPISITQKIMRHSKITTTQNYIHIDTQPMLEAINKIKSLNNE